MAVYSNPIATGLTHKITRGTVSNGALENITGGATTIYTLIFDNDMNAAQTIYVKLFDATTLTPASDHPDLCVRLDADEKNISFTIPGGLSFSNGISMYATVSNGGSGGTVAPGSDLNFFIIHS